MRRTQANPVHKKLKLGPNELACLAEQYLDPTGVPSVDQTIWLRRGANVSTGGDAIDATDSLTQEHIDYVERAVSVFAGLRFCGVDVLIDPEGRADPWVIEVNSKPSVSPHHFPWEGQPRDAMAAVLEAMFPNLPPRR
ncbi:MAG TPA: hypothetical protein VK095_03735 [Beutenbergiaceae bacterium]|nr:hypothetical protein [Beutenbergiaceae bacterium]